MGRALPPLIWTKSKRTAPCFRETLAHICNSFPRVLEYPMEDGETVGLMCLTCPKKACDGCPKVAKTPAKLDKKSNLQPIKRSEPKITLKIKKELIEKSHKKEKKEKKKEKKEKKREKVVIPSGLVMTCSSCSTVFNSVTGLGEHRRLCKGRC